MSGKINNKFDLDVIIVNFNSTDCILHCIESLNICKPENCILRIYVFDNASQDDPKKIIKYFPEVSIKLNKKNIGFGAAINRLLKVSTSELLVLMNPDALASKEIFQDAIEFARQNPYVGITGPKILDDDGSIQGSARSFPTIMTSLFGRSSPITRIFPNNSITRANLLTNQCDGHTPMEVDWVSGACMVVRRKAILAVGGFDNRFFLYWEDADLCRRIREAGWKVIYFPQAKVTHSVGKSSNTRPIFANFQFHKSCYRLYEKYAKWPFSIFVPVAGIALMLRFLIAVIFNYMTGTLNRVRQIKIHQKTEERLKKGKIRILRVISRMNIGGPSIHVKNLTENLNPGRFSTRLITGSVSPGEGDMGYITNFKDNVRIFIPELQREISTFRDLMALIKILKAIQRFHPDIVHSHTSKAGTISRTAILLSNLFRKKKIIAIHTFHGHVLEGYFSNLKSTLFRLIERLLAKDTDRIIAISKTQKWELSNTYRIDNPMKIDIIKLGFDLTPFIGCLKQKGMLRKKIAVSDDTQLVGIVGRMAPIKNHKMFFDAARLLIDDDKGKKLKFILVGDGERRPSLEKYANEIGLNGQVIFHGWEKNIPMVYADLDILALTSLNEGTPVSVIEAMAASVPVVTTGVGGIKDLLGRFQVEQPSQTEFKICERGILCPKDDPVAFFNALKYMIESDYLMDKERFTKARDFVLKNYTMTRLVDEIESLYENLVAS